MATTPDEMRFSSTSIDLLTRVKYAAYRRASALSIEHAKRDGRAVVTEQDVLAVLSTALAETAAEVVESGDGQGTPALAEAAGH